MINGCPAPEELLDSALGEHSGVRDEQISRHVETCETCRRRISDLRAIGALLHSLSIAPLSSACLDADSIAAFADGGGSSVGTHAIEHVASCASCRERLAVVARLTEDATIRSEFMRHNREER